MMAVGTKQTGMGQTDKWSRSFKWSRTENDHTLRAALRRRMLEQGCSLGAVPTAAPASGPGDYTSTACPSSRPGTPETETSSVHSTATSGHSHQVPSDERAMTTRVQL
eukprot:gnl/TRDRNA2_/TRDRNA2_74230_c0_seq1.p1 gnl/TRDRNA2_/TRDRNA2_74230_c0~~gnl/TRDRNA2_/TRDRNA2_74230_c0_seq1.p1  ORF type:complete len:108 (-),score=2.35 gnl/TRDRNA2_/TRDRNA2_74230_c0_seq1:460-783(-)